MGPETRHLVAHASSDGDAGRHLATHARARGAASNGAGHGNGETRRKDTWRNTRR